MRFPFSVQIIAGAVAIQIVMVASLIWSTTRQIERSHLELLTHSAEQQSLLLEAAVIPGLSFADPALLQEILELASLQPGLLFAAVEDVAGRRLATVGTPPYPLPEAGSVVTRVNGQPQITRQVDIAGQVLGFVSVGYSAEHVDILRNAVARQSVVLGLAILALSSLAAVIFGWVATLRLRRLNEGAEAFRQGNLAHRIPGSRYDEVGDLANALNALAANLNASYSEMQQQNERLNRSMARLETLLYGVDATLWEADPNTGQWRFLSGSTENNYGLPGGKLRDASQRRGRVHPEDLARMTAAYATATSKPRAIDYRFQQGSGQQVWLRDIVSSAKASDGSPVLRGLTLNVSVHKAAQLALEESEARYREVIENASEIIFRTDADGHLTLLNPAWQRISGIATETALGRRLADYIVGADQPLLAALFTSLRQGARLFEHGELRIRTATAEERWVAIVLHASRDTSNGLLATFGTLTDIHERKQAEDEIRRLAFFDSLTQLPNRSLLYDRMHQAVANAARTERHGAILFLDLDNFKDINDTLGHDLGDLLLRQVALRIQHTLRETDTLARLGGDEFVLIINNIDQEMQQAAITAEVLARKLIGVLERPFLLGAQERHCSASIGVTLFGSTANQVDELLKQADLAMYQAKSAGRNTVRFFEPGMQHAVKKRALLEADFRKSLQNNEFFLHYQPHVDRHGKLLGAEALLRWHHPERGLVPPLTFIPVAEQTGLIQPLGEQVLVAACAQLAAWQRQKGWADLRIAVNVSAKQFHHPDFTSLFLSILEQSGAPADRLTLELTESMLLEDHEEIIKRMNILRERGVGFALDDFGTGYSSLAYLKRLPLTVLKIDQSFVHDILVDPNDAAIARTILSLAHTLNLEVIAEGVESEAQYQALVEMGCRQFQGYWFGRPGPVDALAKLLDPDQVLVEA